MKVVICGAGIAGLALAHQLAGHGADVVVLEQAPGPRTQGYMIDFFGVGYDAAEAMGVLPRMDELGYRVEEARLVDANGRRTGRIQFAQFGRTVAGRLMSIMRPDIELALRESVEGRVDLRYATSLTHVENGRDGVAVTLTDGQVLRADLLVGADGIHSAVRRLAFGDGDGTRYLGFHTAAYTFRDPGVHARVGDAFHLTDSIDRQVGLYALRDGRVATFMVHRAADPALPADPRAALRAEYGSLGWLVPTALAHCPDPEEIYYDQVAQVILPRWHRDRVVLLGDAAYAVSLLAGQGASLGIAGAYVLAEQLHRAGTIEDAFLRYEQLWRPAAEEKQRAGRNAIRWFLPGSPAQLRLRRVMLALARLPGLDRLIASGIAGKQSAIVTQLTNSTEGVPSWR